MAQFQRSSLYYDALYKDKDYLKEVKFVKKFIKKYSPKSKKILSLGCGTCSYEIILSRSGYEITGIDLSKEMLQIASEKIKKAHLDSKIKLFQKNVQNFHFEDKYDVALAMFNIVGYQIKNKEFESMLKNVNDSLKPNGIFLFDCWYMPAVLKDKPTDRVKRVKFGNKEIIRLTKSKLYQDKNMIEINFDILELDKKNLLSEGKETHNVRYWSLPEIECFLENAGFSIIKVCNFMDENSHISEDNWNIFIAARKNI